MRNQSLREGGGGAGWGARPGPPITPPPLVNFPNSRLPNQQNKKHNNRQNCSLNVTREETSSSNNCKFLLIVSKAP